MGSALPDVVPEGGQIQIVIGFFEILTKRVFEKKVAKTKVPYYTTNPRTQKVTLPEEAQIQIVLENFENFHHFFAAKVPGVLSTAPSLPDPTSLT
mgnify:CR=1 FL=1